MTAVERIRIQHLAEKLSAQQGTQGADSKSSMKKTSQNVSSEEQKLVDMQELSKKKPTLQEAVDETFWTPSMTKAVYIGSALLLFVLLFELTHTCGSRHDFSETCPTITAVEGELSRSSSGPIIAGFYYWGQYISEFPIFFVLCWAGIIGFVFLGQYGQTMLVEWSGDFWDKMQYWGNYGGEGQENRLFSNLLKFQWLATMVVLSSVYQGYIDSIFCLHVRNYMSDKFAKDWLGGFAYYRMEIASLNDKSLSDNPDQRIQEDIKTHVDKTTSLLIGVLSNCMQMYLFTIKVWNVSPEKEPITGRHVQGWLLYAVYGYVLVVFAAMLIVGRQLELVQMTSQRTEADYRWELISVRQHAEQLAVYRSEDVHELRILDRFKLVARLVWEEMFITKKMGITFAMFSQTKEIFPCFFLGPGFLAGQISFGELMAASRSMALLESALLWFPGAYPKYVGWRASTGRLIRVQEAFERNRNEEMAAKVVRQPEQTTPDASKLTSVELSVWLPNHKKEKPEFEDVDADTDVLAEEGAASSGKGPELFDNLRLDMAPGERALLVGPSGTGKTTLLRTLAGAWPHAEGKVFVPSGNTGAMFTTTETYAPPGPLRGAVAYPLSDKDLSDKEIREALNIVGLQHLAAGEEGLSISRYWEFTLSAGQKNRLALARIALHKPKLCVLDEPVAHLDEANRASTLKAALDTLPPDAAVLCVSHELSSEVRNLFTHQYDVDIVHKTLKKSSLSWLGGSSYTAPPKAEAKDPDGPDDMGTGTRSNKGNLCCY